MSFSIADAPAPYAAEPMQQPQIHVTIVEDNHSWSYLGSIIRNLRDCPFAIKIAAIAIPLLMEVGMIVGAAYLGARTTPLVAAFIILFPWLAMYEISAAMREIFSALNRRV